MDRFVVDNVPCNEALRTPVIDRMVRHSSVREYDLTRSLPEGLVEMLVTAAQSASTSSNFQVWSVVEVADPERRKLLQRYANDQPLIGQAPLFLVFCGDISRLRWVTQRQGYPFNANFLDLALMAAIDSSLACQNAALAAESLGLGICMVGTVRNRPREIAELLGLPEGAFANMGLAVGWPAKQNEVKPRLPHSVVLHRERYSVENLEAAMEEYDARMAQTTIYRNRRVRVPGRTPPPEEDTGHYGWIEHTARRMAVGNGVRGEMRPFLLEQGFELR